MRRVAESQHARAREIGSHIPFGQPVLIGHHSQRRHERDIQRIDRAMHASIAASKEAEELERRARSSERNRVISSDDPEALRKLREKLRDEEELQDRTLRANKILRKAAHPPTATTIREVASTMGWTPERTASHLGTLHSMGQRTFHTTNNAAEIRRIKGRIADMEKRVSTPVRATERIGAVEIREDENRVKLIYPGKPSEHVRKELKSAGFRWSPTSGAWQRHASEGAWYHARRIAGLGT